jgi:hypothetical protein
MKDADPIWMPRHGGMVIKVAFINSPELTQLYLQVSREPLANF